MSVRRVVPLLIDDNNLEEIINLSQREVFGERELDMFIQHAIRKEKKLIWLYLLNYKSDRYGFREKDYIL